MCQKRCPLRRCQKTTKRFSNILIHIPIILSIDLSVIVDAIHIFYWNSELFLLNRSFKCNKFMDYDFPIFFFSYKESNYPIMNLHERVLSVLACRVSKIVFICFPLGSSWILVKFNYLYEIVVNLISSPFILWLW